MADGASERNRVSAVDIPPTVRRQITETDLQRFDAGRMLKWIRGMQAA